LANTTIIYHHHYFFFFFFFHYHYNNYTFISNNLNLWYLIDFLFNILFLYRLDHKSTTSTQISIWHSEWNPLEQQEKFIIKPPLTNNGSNTGLTNDLLNQIFNNITTSTNSSSEKSIYFNLIDLPPSSWNLSLNSSANIVLDVTLPSPVYPSYSNTTTNLTFTNIQANRFSTNINGMPINLQLDRVHTKQFSLIMNTTDNVMNRNPNIQHSSDIIIGHVKSEQFELNLTKSDNMHVHIEQVDSATAELYLDSNFCTNESSLEINLNLSKNGKKKICFFNFIYILFKIILRNNSLW
jgi:hypothetical protein